MPRMLILFLLAALSQAGSLDVDCGNDEACTERLAQEPAWRALVVSAALCEAQQQKTEALQAIKEERAAGKTSGYVDATELNRYGHNVTQADITVRNMRATLKAWHLKALRCDEPAVTAAATCLKADDEGESVNGPCDAPGAIQALRVAHVLFH
jgi:hypothetical protein